MAGKTEYKNSFNAEKYDRIWLMTKKGTKQVLQDVAAQKGLKLQGYIKTVLKKQYKDDTGEEIEL